jgi:hypothetical protein
MASACLWWEPLKSKEEIKAEFRSLMSSGNRGKIASLYPDVAALMWVLDRTDIADTMTDVELEVDTPVQALDAMSPQKEPVS